MGTVRGVRADLTRSDHNWAKSETGNVDDLQALGEISRQVGAHFHVDACWGGSALLVDEYRPLFEGIEMADSVSIDAHKLLFCPMSMGIILFQSEKDKAPTD